MAVKLFRHNKETYNNIVEMFKTENRVGVIQPTGTGKSFLFLKLIEDNPKKQFILLSPSNEIFIQLKEYVNESSDINLFKNVYTLTYQKLNLMTEEEIKALNINFIILDEFHRIGAEYWNKAVDILLQSFPKAKVLGATATPVRYLDNIRDMSVELFNCKLARDMTLGEAVHKHILPTPTYIPVWYDFDGKLERYQNDIYKIADPKDREELKKQLDSARRHLEKAYNAQIIFKKNMPTDTGKYIVFCRSINHINMSVMLLRRWLKHVNENINVYISVHDRADKDKQLQMFKDDNDTKAMKLLFTVDRLNEGVHVKGIDGVIMLRPTKSPIIYLQQMGRALASKSTKPIIFDMVNNYQNVQIPFPNGNILNVFEKELRDAIDKISSEAEPNEFQIFDQMMEFSKIFSKIENSIYINREENWLNILESYKQFKKEFNKEPEYNEVYQNFCLGYWCNHQRYAYRTGTMPIKRIELLEKVDFRFDTAVDTKWMTKFLLLKKFVTIQYRFPKRNEHFEGSDLNDWCSKQRKRYKSGRMTEEEENLLRELNFDFRTREERDEESWLDQYNATINFKSKYGRFPVNDEKYNGFKIGVWCQKQKHANVKEKLSIEHKRLLDEIGFDFEAKEVKLNRNWDYKYNLVQEYKTYYGTLPGREDIYKGIKIGSWLSKQISLCNLDKLSEERVRHLQNLGIIQAINDNTTSTTAYFS